MDEEDTLSKQLKALDIVEVLIDQIMLLRFQVFISNILCVVMFVLILLKF